MQPMPGYQVKFEDVVIGGANFHIRSLRDNQQYADPLGIAEQRGIPPAGWALFGLVWPSARVLALGMASHGLAGKRVLEIGAGLGLASLVMHRRGGDITVSDLHPLSAEFFAHNLRLNALAPMPHYGGAWADVGGAGDALHADTRLGRFDLIVGSDVLYERQQPAQLANFIDRHSAEGAEVLIVDPDRGNRSDFRRLMAQRGFRFDSHPAERQLENGVAYKGRWLRFVR